MRADHNHKPLTRTTSKAELCVPTVQWSFKKLDRRLIRLDKRLEQIEGRIATKDDMNRIMTALEGLAATATAFCNRLGIHDQRIKVLEEKVGS